jgi:hypothetical protein
MISDIYIITIRCPDVNFGLTAHERLAPSNGCNPLTSSSGSSSSSSSSIISNDDTDPHEFNLYETKTSGLGAEGDYLQYPKLRISTHTSNAQPVAC